MQNAYASGDWTVKTNYYIGVVACNWMKLGLFEWTITPDSSNVGTAFQVGPTGTIYGVGVTEAEAVRPVFYLKNNVTYVSGTGTPNDPIIIN